MKRKLFLMGGFAALAGCGGGSSPYSAKKIGGTDPTPAPTPTGDFSLTYRLTRNRWPADILYVVTVTGTPGFTTPVTVNNVAMIPSVAGTEREFSLLPVPDDAPGSYGGAVPLWVTGTTPDGKSAKSPSAFLNTPTPGIAVSDLNDGLTRFKTQKYNLKMATVFYGRETDNWEGALTLSLDRNPPEIVGKTTLPLPSGAILDGLPTSVTIQKGDYGVNQQSFPLTLTLPDDAPEGKLYRFRIRAIDPGSGKSVSATVVKQYGQLPLVGLSATQKNVVQVGAATRLIYDLVLTPLGGFKKKLTNLRASAGPTLGFPPGTTYSISPGSADFSAGGSSPQTLALNIDLLTSAFGTFSVQIDADVSDGSKLSEVILVGFGGVG